MVESDGELSRIGSFALEERLGDPPGQHVYRGIHVEQRQSFAVRLLPKAITTQPLAHKTFSQDVQSLVDLRHRHIVRCFGGAVDQGHPFLVSELVKGESVAESMARRGRLPWESAVDITLQLCQALLYSHSRKLLHERITPDKVLLDEQGQVKLTGFGSAWFARYASRGKGNVPLDTACFLAPEQLQGELPVTLRSDVYGIGTVLYTMVTGQPPFAEANTLEQLLAAKCAQKPPRVTSIEFNAPVWLDVLVARLLAPVPTDRYATAQHVIDAVEEAKRNVASGVSTAQRALASRSSSLSSTADRAELNRIRKKKIRKKDDSPFYEQAWFLAICLAAVIGGLTFALWPASEEELYQQAAVLMASDDTTDWWRAKEDYLIPLQERFPKGKYAQKVQQWLEQIEMEQAENRFHLNAQLGKTPTSEGERLYAQAWRYEQFGDRISALAKYRALVNLLKESPKKSDRPFVSLSQRKISQITSGEEGGFDRAEFVQQHLDRADKLAEQGKLIAARRIWESVVNLYTGNKELQPLVEQAQQKIGEQE